MDWVSFLEANNIPYITRGPSVTKNHICIKCCWCGIADPSEHLSISLVGQGFRCWRQPLHSGKNPAKLIQALLGCSWEQATNLAGNAKTLPNDFLSKMKASLVKKEEVKMERVLSLPEEFKEFNKKPSCRMYAEYLRQRRFNDKNIFEDTKDYGIYYASKGLYKGRVIFTIVYDGQLVGWTGRTISANQMMRYDTLTHDAEKAYDRGEVPAPNPISHYLLFYDRIIDSNADTIILCEGPFDAWRVNLLGESLGVVSTCFFTSTLSEQQLNLLHEVLPKFKNRFLLLDENTFSKATRIKSDLITLGVQVKRLLDGIKDPGELISTRDLKNVLAFV
jgi:hypothetical protein